MDEATETATRNFRVRISSSPCWGVADDGDDDDEEEEDEEEEEEEEEGEEERVSDWAELITQPRSRSE